MTLEALQVAYGDCLLVSCSVPDGTWRLLVDMGPDDTWSVVHDRLVQLPSGEDGKRHIDLAIVTHIDHDHIGGARLLFADDSLGLTFGDVWFNARRHLERGVAEGEGLTELLGAANRDLPWNKAFAGGPVVTPGDGGFTELPTSAGYPRITLLSPTPKRLDRLARVWDAEWDRLRRRESNTEDEGERGSEFPDLKSLASHPSRKDQAPPNGSSIAVMIEHRGASLLLAADAFPTVLGSALLGLAKHRGVSVPLHVDVFKLSHHGSRANMRTELLNVVQADHYVVSTDNSRFGHPNDEALARIVLYGGKKPTLWFNHSTVSNLRWADNGLQRKYSFSARFPEGGNRSITVPIPRRRGER